MRYLILLFCMCVAATANAQSVNTPWPARQADIPTTDAAIYLGNLDDRIAALDGAFARSPRAALKVAKAGALYHRYRIGGRVEDAEAAQALLDTVLAQEPRDVEALMLRATVLSGFHRFKDAQADLLTAQAAGAKPTALAESRREIALATGRYPELRADFEHSTDPNASFYELAFRGNLRLQQGDLDGASQQFRRAQALFTDSSPMPLAWLHVQQGIAYLRSHRYEEAAVFFRAAHERLPGFTLATEHLAEAENRLGHYSVSRKLYLEAIADTGSPEFMAALATVEKADGHADRAAKLQAQAGLGWQQWLERHPAAFAQHAIPWFLDRGDSAMALQLARQNIGLRQDVGSYILLARAEHAAGDDDHACSARKAALATGLRPPELSELEVFAGACTAPMASR